MTRPSKSCPVCKKPVAEKYAPFCSRRCADVDLGRWLGEQYKIPVREEEDEDGSGGKEGEHEKP